MSKFPGLRPLGQVTAYTVVTGGVIGGGVASLLTAPGILMAAQLGFVLFTLPAFALGQAVGVLTGLLAPSAARIALMIVHPTTLLSLRVSTALTTTALCALPAAVLVTAVGVPLSLYRDYPYAILVVVIPSILVAPIAAWRLAPSIGRSPRELDVNRPAHVGWWLIAVGVLPVASMLCVYASAWVGLNFSFDAPRDGVAVGNDVMVPLAVVATASTALLAAGLALTWRAQRWEHAGFVLTCSTAALCTSLLSAIAFWRLVIESAT